MVNGEDKEITRDSKLGVREDRNHEIASDDPDKLANKVLEPAISTNFQLPSTSLKQPGDGSSKLGKT